MAPRPVSQFVECVEQQRNLGRLGNNVGMNTRALWTEEIRIHAQRKPLCAGNKGSSVQEGQDYKYSWPHDIKEVELLSPVNK